MLTDLIVIMIYDSGRIADMADQRATKVTDDTVRGRSASHGGLARRRGRCRDPRVSAGIAEAERQPNLLFAAEQHLFGTPVDWDNVRATLLAQRNAIATDVLNHTVDLPDRPGGLLTAVNGAPVAWTDPQGAAWSGLAMRSSDV